MSARQGSGSSIAPIFLRLSLGIVFVWAGLGKITQDMPVQGDAAAVLANMGVISPASKPAAMSDTSTMPVLMGLAGPQDTPKAPAPKEPAPKEPPATTPPASPTAVPVKYTAADFPQPVVVKQLHGLTIMLANATVVPTDEKGVATKMRLIPQPLGARPWPVVLAWCAAITELVGGAMLLVGLFARFWGLGIATVMGTAMWLTQIGPAIQAGTARMGFLPSHPAYDPQAWTMPMFQLSLMTSALAILFLGSGSLSLDALFFARPAAPSARLAPADKPAQG